MLVSAMSDELIRVCKISHDKTSNTIDSISRVLICAANHGCCMSVYCSDESLEKLHTLLAVSSGNVKSIKADDT
jgi:hypothetical protein